MRLTLIILTLAFAALNYSFANKCVVNLHNQNSIADTIYSDVDEEAIYIGGEDSLHAKVVQNFIMPKTAMDLEVSGLIFIQFIVEKDGSVTNVKSIAPAERKLGYGLEEECIRVIKLTSGNWIPAKLKGKEVRSYWRFPFMVENTSGFEKKKKRKRK